MRITKRQRAAATPGFAIQILRDTDLGIATLIVEDEEGHYEPVNYASSLGEGFEMAKEDLRNRQGKLEADKDPGLCPWEYKVWARVLEGKMAVAATWNVRTCSLESSRSLSRQPLQRDFLEGAVFFVQSVLSAPLLPASNNHIAVQRVDLEEPGSTTVLRAGYQRGTGSGEGVAGEDRVPARAAPGDDGRP